MRVAILAAACVLGFGTAANGALIHDYELNGTYADSVGAVALTGNGGTLGATGLTFGVNQGPTLSTAIGPVYTIETRFSFDALSGFRKITSFANNSVDTGFYNLNAHLNFFNVTTSVNTVFTAGQLATVVLTRDAAKLVNGYVDGVLAFSFTDSSNLADPGSALYFFQDDSATGGGEASSGFVDYIRIYDTANAPLAVPELATWATMLGGFGLMGAAMRRCRAMVRATA